MKFEDHPELNDCEVSINPEYGLIAAHPLDYCSSLRICGAVMQPDGTFICEMCGREKNPREPRVCDTTGLVRAKGVGTIFDEIVQAESPFGKPKTCDRCVATLEKLNHLGPVECRNQFDELVSEIVDNAKQHKSIAGVIANMRPAQSWEWIADRLDRAITRATAAEERVRTE